MARTYSTTLLAEDWSKFPLGPLHRDNTARGEYMAMVVPDNPGGWYHNANAGAGVGPGACYAAEGLIGVEIQPAEAERAERNVRRIDPTGVARVVPDDAIDFVRGFSKPINLLYLDADGTPDRGKGVYLDILQAGLDRMGPGAVVLAHNSFNCAEKLTEYLAFVRDTGNFAASVNVLIDPEGLEVSVR